MDRSHSDEAHASQTAVPEPSPRAALTRSAFLKRAAATGVGASAVGTVLQACGSGGSTVAAPPPGGGNSAPVKPNINAKYKGKKIGFALLTTADENVQSVQRWVKRAVADAGLGWTITTSDVMGSLATSQSTLNAYITQKVDGILMLGLSAGQLESQLASAKAANIPTVGAYTFAPLGSSISQDYTLPPDADASLLGNYLIADQLKRRPSGKIKVAMLDFTADVIQARRFAFKGLVQQQPRFEIVAEDYNISLTNTAGDSSAAARTILQAHPDLAAIWCNDPPIALPAASGVAQSGKTDVQVYGHIANSAGVEALRGGQSPLVATSWVDLPYLAYTFVDQLLLAMSGKKLDRKLNVTQPDPAVVFDATNVDAQVTRGTKAGDWMFGGGTYRTSFLKSWNTLYA
ncbi:MAG TPA: sugar ABC transporter substrate-binding protein [Conexibacter sp.]|jgi:ABC-type sugar transport system substrate-binding protein|nr:sugar ABC transporter substrate-binding protein [Conexibacter sp.]